MFSEFTKFIAQPTRHAEETDTRAAMQRHDPDYHRKKQTKQDSTESTYKDATEISIDAAILFLSDLINREHKDQKSLANSAKQQLDSFSKPTAIHASHAYEHAAETASTKPQNAQKTGHNTLRDLIERLKTLKTTGIEILSIETDGDFLQSLSSAADRALTTT